MVAESKLEELRARTAALFENFSHELLEKWLETKEGVLKETVIKDD